MNKIKILNDLYEQSRRNITVNCKGSEKILESLHYRLLLNEKKAKELINSRNAEMEQKHGNTKLSSLETLIKEYKKIREELKEKEAQFMKSIERDSKIAESDFVKIEKMMKQMEMTEYIVDGITAKISQRKTGKGNTKWKSVVEDALIKLNEEGKKLINKLIKKHTTFPIQPEKLNIESKQNRKKINKLIEMIEKRTGKRIYIKEGIMDSIRSIFNSITSYTRLLITTRKKLKKVLEQLDGE